MVKKERTYYPGINEYRDTVTIDIDGWEETYLCRSTEERKLPNIGGFCKHCATETSKPVHAIIMNGQPAYILQCFRCKRAYPMYESTFKVRYIGYDAPNGGHVNPTKGGSILNSMDRKARQHHVDIPKRVEADMCEMLHISHEEYAEMKERWDKEHEKVAKKLRNDALERQAKLAEDRRTVESANRKELIRRGVLKYKKGIGLVNTETGEVVKL